MFLPVGVWKKMGEWQTLYTLIRRRVLRRLIWVYTVCSCLFVQIHRVNTAMWSNRPHPPLRNHPRSVPEINILHSQCFYRKKKSVDNFWDVMLFILQWIRWLTRRHMMSKWRYIVSDAVPLLIQKLSAMISCFKFSPRTRLYRQIMDGQ